MTSGYSVTPAEKTARAIVVDAMITRLESTYEDFITGVKGFDQIPMFFRDHLYSPANKDERDAALENLYNKLRSITGPEMTENIHKLIVLVQLTDSLDVDTGRVLLNEGTIKGESTDEKITIEQLNDATGKAGRFDDREKQVDMICDTLGFFFTLSKLPLIKLVMAPIKVSASLVGASDLVSTMETGYAVSRGIKDMKPFMEAFNEREKKKIAEIKKTMGVA